MKKCTKCKNSKKLDQFYKLSANKDGLNNQCKDCISLRDKQYRDTNSVELKTKRKNYYQKHLEKMRQEKRKYYYEHQEEKSDYDKRYRKRNKEKIKGYKRNWAKKNKNNIHYKLKGNLRRRIHHAIKGDNKSNSTEILLGCSIDFFIAYIEALFLPNMTWDNYGIHGWHLDHIKPCSSFDLSDPEQQKQCFHYSNQQPLWWQDNLSKGSKINF